MSRTITAAALAVCCAVATAPAHATTVVDDDVAITSPYNDTTIGWSTPDAPSAQIQSRSAEQSFPAASASQDYSFESKELPDGAQTLIHINSDQAPRQYAFPIDLGDNDRLETMEDGTVALNSDRFPQGAFEAPWAKDANGVDIPTHFEVKDNQLIQIVDFDSDTAFPIVADPQFNWGNVSGHVYLNKSETKKAAAAAGGGGIAALPWLALVPPPFSVVIGSNVVNIGIWATAAVAQNKCLQLKLGATGGLIPPRIGVTPEHYTGGYCR
ncbi:hypothetical protein [Corynebacterium sp. AOP12-C2-36]|uniref:hypothetical protein n=1 Tax=Corynebacterium sp. AOP12-C2-36 TaxID=3457723 RepID=UPI0040349080